MEFCLLGPLLVRRQGVAVPVSSGKQRALLASLLLNANRVVQPDQLAEVLWGAGTPLSARASLQNHVMRLRKTLADDSHSRIVRQDDGYLIIVEADELDLDRFETSLAAAQAAAARQSWAEASDLLRTALSLWRGEPLSGVPSATLTLQEVPRLAELRLRALEAHIEAELHLGRHADVIAELRLLTAAHPLREHLYVLLMLALYRCGRQAEALAAFQQARRVLVDEAGVEPGSELQELHQRVLAADAGLTGPTGPDSAAVAPGPAGTHPEQAMGPAAVVPQELPGLAPYFVGRENELAALTEVLDQADRQGPGTVVISAVGGMAGVGKTALAVHWAHQVAGRFPDGQLYANLRGFDPSGTPVRPAEVIRSFLDAMGVPSARIPLGLAAQDGLYRSLVAGRRILILLDNARDEQQVRPLLPASPGCLVIVTSRSQLAGLAAVEGARLLGLDQLSHAEAGQMLAARLGSGRAAAEPDAVTDIAELCARLPLALAVAAARANALPGLPLSALAADLHDAQKRLDVLDAGDPAASVRAVFSWSTDRLSAAAARMFRLLGLHPGPDISARAAASLAGIPPREARQALGELTRVHLVTEQPSGRYAFHDLLRAYAAEQASLSYASAELRTAAGRMLDHYLHAAHQASMQLDPQRDAITLAAPLEGVTAEPLADAREAVAWFEAEDKVLVAAISLAADTGFDAQAWQLAWATSCFLHRRGRLHDWAAIQRTAIEAANRAGDVSGRAVTYRLAGSACVNLGDYQQGRAYLMSALGLYQELGDRIGEARIHQTLGFTTEFQGHHLTDALQHYERALLLFQAAGHKEGNARALNGLGWIHILLGDLPRGRALCRQALALFHQVDDPAGEVDTWHSLGYAEQQMGCHDEAAACYDRALDLCRKLGYRFIEARTLALLGDTRHASADTKGARQAWLQALAILDDLDHPDAQEVRAKLSAAPARGVTPPNPES